jgi:hypothetical protein
MKNFSSLCSCAVILLLIGGPAAAAEKETNGLCRLMAEFADGGLLVGSSTGLTLAVKTEYSRLELPLKLTREIAYTRKDGKATLRLNNGDQFVGELEIKVLPMDTILGIIKVPLDKVMRLRVSAMGAGLLPPGEGPLNFCGFQWAPLRRDFEVRDNRIVPLARARPGFEYGQNGHGRGGFLLTNPDNQAWRNYRIEFTIVISAADPQFNPYGLPADGGGIHVFFHVVALQEDWNVNGTSGYSLGFDRSGAWDLSCGYHGHCPGERGWNGWRDVGRRNLAKGDGLKVAIDKEHQIAVEVDGTNIRIWFDNQKIADVQDEKMNEPVNGVTLDHGGVSIGWPFEYQGWMKDFTARTLP